MFVVSAAIGEMIIPLIVGKVFDYVGSVSFLAEGCILCFAAFGAYLAVLVIGKGAASHGQKREGNTNDIRHKDWRNATGVSLCFSLPLQ